MSPKSILLTGCSAEGIGAALALALARRGHRIFATARNTSKIPESLSSLHNVQVVQLDVADTASVARAAETVAQAGYGLDVLVNNAGVGYAQPVLDMDIAKAQHLHDINVWGPVRTIQAFSTLLIASHGRVVNISSVGAIVNTPWISAYAASKAALTSISETLRLELSSFGVSVATIMVGIVDSKFHANDSNFKLPQDSRYAPIEKFIASWASGEAKPKGCSAEQFAESLVDDLVGSRAGLIYRGPRAGAVKLVAQWAPMTVADLFMRFNQGLQELSTHNRQGNDGGEAGSFRLSSLKWLLLFLLPLSLIVLYTLIR